MRDADAARRKTSTGKAAEIEAMLEPTLESMGFRIVRVQLAGNKREKTLQIMAERTDGSGMDVDACAEVSRAAEAILDVEDPIDTAYTLEVSSPGIDRPLTRLSDFHDWAGFDARVELEAPRDGRRRYKGPLLGIRDGYVRIRADGVEHELPFDEIAKAKLVLTDELIDWTRAREDGTDN
ncbi:ribosome maturation factor RimP [Limimonas halophila]|uniref:Ribosome maturation factor RimP n=1 Tax=Limimonas halophila TaxID=1082479 RepID=A0A1G7SLD3_9PROT|nr:ribosome maturation factor RimP [Limimonas halophila]SDG23249.1 ribosome maturation factor RimP [Limimonas halophila]